ncbi:MAG: type IV toxin-antitoxin system AbiEi family antitoxin [Pseudomonadales bacterium]|jgi:hypothetical protein|nr:type IV toxin-antitoxin system AbiEi family antitoxin [Pseudomonadales bacterium]
MKEVNRGLQAIESSLLERALEALQETTRGRVHAERLREPRPLAKHGKAAARFVLRYDGSAHRFHYEIKPRLDPRAVTAAAAQFETVRRTSGTTLVLVTEHVSQRLAAELIDQNVQFLDAAGNAFLSVEEFFLLVTGRPRHRSRKQASRQIRTTWSRGALPVVHRLLNEPEGLQMSFRDLAKASTVSLGTVHNVMDDLKARGFLRTLGGKPRLVGRERLFEQWVESYPQYLRERLVRRRLTVPGRKDLGLLAEEVRSALGEQDWVMSGECAAWVMDGYLPPERMTLYGNGELDRLASLLGARSAADGDIEVLQAFWTGHTSPGGAWGLADPILVYADLVYTQDPRAREAALRIRDEYLRIEEAAG